LPIGKKKKKSKVVEKKIRSGEKKIRSVENNFFWATNRI
jgi:hypothetical protein